MRVFYLVAKNANLLFCIYKYRIYICTMKQNKKPMSFRFHPSDLLKWKRKAKKYNLTLTEYLERKANDDNNDKHLFI